MTRSEHIRALLEEYAARRAQNALELRAREQRAYALDPRLRELREQSVAVAMDAMRAVVRADTDAARRKIAEDMRTRGVLINGEVRARLAALGLPENELEEWHRCDLCRDTGYVGDAPARFCACFERALVSRMQREHGDAEPQAETFETFMPERIPMEDGQRQKTVRAKEICEKFADDYAPDACRTLVLTGPGGLGKTFLLNAIYARVTGRGFAAMRVTAFHMFETMRRQHVGSDPEFEGFQALIGAPLLLIDDLGSEPMMRNITVEYLFMLINERMVRGLSTGIATNLSPAQIQERYGERVFSRLFDRSRGTFIKLEGRDLRQCTM